MSRRGWEREVSGALKKKTFSSASAVGCGPYSKDSVARRPQFAKSRKITLPAAENRSMPRLARWSDGKGGLQKWCGRVHGEEALGGASCVMCLS